jgi:hypothetical protein
MLKLGNNKYGQLAVFTFERKSRPGGGGGGRAHRLIFCAR